MKLCVTLDVEVEALEEKTLEQIGLQQVRANVAEAIKNAVQYAEGEGHVHELAEEISILHKAIHVSDDTKPSARQVQILNFALNFFQANLENLQGYGFFEDRPDPPSEHEIDELRRWLAGRPLSDPSDAR